LKTKPLRYSLGLAWLLFTLTSPNRDMQATTTMFKQFGLLYNDPLLKREIVASLGPVRPSLLIALQSLAKPPSPMNSLTKYGRFLFFIPV
jgi:hypothetical protein